MKVLMLNYEYPPLGGGAANANEYILKEMSDIEDIEIDLVTSSENGYKENDISENISIYRLNVKKEDIHHWSQIEILRYFFKGLLKSRELKKKNEYDVVHAWFGFPCGLMALILNKPFIVSLRGSDVPGYNERFSYQYIFLTPVIKQVWKKAEKVIANSSGLKELARETLDTSIDVIPNGVNIREFYPSNAKQRDSEKIQLICVARLTPRKRVQDILKAVQGLDHVELTLIGKGPEEENLKEMAKELGIDSKTNFEGYIPHEDIADFYRDSDIFIMPSLNEGMSNTILEAMASGLPIITTQTGGTDELIDENGFIVPKKDPSAIREAIREYMSDYEKIAEHSNNSRDRAEKLSWKSVADQYLEVYNSPIT